jgi:hypothetical protein
MNPFNTYQKFTETSCRLNRKEMYNMKKGRLLKGATQIAGYVLDDESKFRSIYPLAGQLGLFKVGGMLAGFTHSIDAKMADLERAGLGQRRKRRREVRTHEIRASR